jgi:siroheme synthase
LPAITAELIKHGLAAASPAITVADAAMPSQQSVQGTLADIAALADKTARHYRDRRGGWIQSDSANT